MYPTVQMMPNFNTGIITPATNPFMLYIMCVCIQQNSYIFVLYKTPAKGQ